MLRSMAELGHCDASGFEDLPTEFREITPPESGTAPQWSLRVKRSLGYSGTYPATAGFRKPEALGDRFPDLIIINDAGSELRHSFELPANYFCGILDRATQGACPTCDIVMKMHLPLAQKHPWQRFCAATAARTRVLVVHADDLRMSGVPISACTSWDRCADDVKLAWHLKNAMLHALVQPDVHVVVLFDVEGAMVLSSTGKGDLTLKLIFDPQVAEGDIAETLPGDMVGKMNAFLVHLSHQIVMQEGEVALDGAVEQALTVSRYLGESTFELEGDALSYPPIPDWLTKTVPPRGLPAYHHIDVGQRAGATDLLATTITQQGTSHMELARSIVKHGVKAVLPNLPHGRFGKLWTVDRDEIDAMRSVDQLIRIYTKDKSRTKPLSLSVFGPPGAGKSFGVKQLVDEDETPIREYNLSQVRAEQLPTFFHEIRDLNLQGKLPLCFFDEFDSQDRGLLKYFLAPMQDGVFLEGDAVRPIGRGIFVFAGGTAATFGQFTQSLSPPGASEPGNDSEAAHALAQAKAQKLPDFVSRLHGFINVKGPNPVDPDPPRDGTLRPFEVRAAADPSYVLRRAILLRIFLQDHHSGIISRSTKAASIEDALLNALLDARDFTHGARSLELLVRAMASTPNMRGLGRSDLPIDGQLKMYVTQFDMFKKSLIKKSP